MNAIDVKKLVDFDMIMNIINLCFANQDRAVDIEFEFNGKKYTIKKEKNDESVCITRDKECGLEIRCDFGMHDRENPNILIEYREIGIHFEDYKNQAPTVHLWSEGFLAKSDDVAKNFDVTLTGDFGHISYHLNELDGSNIPVEDDLNSGALIFGEDGVRYRDYLFANNGKLLYRNQEVPSKAELEIKYKDTNEDPTVEFYVRDRLEFYKNEYRDFVKVIKLRKRILNSGMDTYLFTRQEMFMLYLKLYKELVKEKQATIG